MPPPESFVARLRGSEFAGEIERLAESIRAHRFPLLGYVLETGPDVRWRRDYIHEVESDLVFFRRLPYLDARVVGDHKIIWELNRHQHLVVLAQAWQLTGRREFLDEIPRQLESWWRQNLFVRGINWTSALEVAFRALSWIWIYHLAGPGLTDEFKRRLLNELYRHGVFLRRNLSVYFSPNTHLLGEAVALHALGVLFPDWPGALEWKALGGRIVADQMDRQVRNDGSHFEQSSAYHVYATDFFLFHALLERRGEGYLDKLRWMTDYLTALSSSDGAIPLLGDDDGGNLFHPYGNQRRFGMATLAACCVFFGRNDWPCAPASVAAQAAWWFGEAAFAPRTSGSRPAAGARLFPDAGVALLSSTPAHIVVDARAFGHANAGHSHAHALHVVCRHNGQDVLIDPGTYTYVGEPEWRSRFRGTAFHNTIRIDALDQATGTGPFRWVDKPDSEVLRWTENPEWRLLDAACTYRGFEHRRLLLWMNRQQMLAVVDVVRSEEGTIAASHGIEQFWHCGDVVTASSQTNYRIGAEAMLAVASGSHVELSEGGAYGWKSEAPGQKIPRPVIIVERQTTLPAVLGAILFLRPQTGISLAVEAGPDRIRLSGGSGQLIEISLTGDPIIEWGSAG